MESRWASHLQQSVASSSIVLRLQGCATLPGSDGHAPLIHRSSMPSIPHKVYVLHGHHLPMILFRKVLHRSDFLTVDDINFEAAG